MNNESENQVQAQWYVIHTYSGYENKVMDSLLSVIENMSLQDYILEVKIPVEDVLEIKNDKRKIVQHKLYPGYVMIKMIMNKQTRYVVRNTRGVTGFVGPGSKEPIPLSNEEVRRMGVENVPIKLNIIKGDFVNVISGPLDGFQGTVEEVDAVHQKVRVIVSMFGRETPVELDFGQVKRL